MSISYDQKFGCTHKIAMPWDKGGKSISWKLRVTKPGSYRLISDQAFAPGLEGARYQILINDQKFESLPITTKNGRDFIEVEIGSVHLMQWVTMNYAWSCLMGLALSKVPRAIGVGNTLNSVYA